VIPFTAPKFILHIDQSIPVVTPATHRNSGRGAYVVLLPASRAGVPIKTALYLRRIGVRSCWLHEAGGWAVLAVEDLLSELVFTRKIKPRVQRLIPAFCPDDARIGRAMGSILRGRSRHDELRDDNHSAHRDNDRRSSTIAYTPTGESVWRTAIAEDNARFQPLPSEPDRPLRVTQYIGSLSSGGAERQLCNLAIGLAQRDIDVRIMTTYESSGDEGHGHYAPLLCKSGLQARCATESRCTPDVAQRFRWDLLAATPPGIRPFITRLALELAGASPPADILHCWLDHPNIMGALAGFVAGVPRILLSTRNSNPTNFPRLYAPYMDTWYRLLAHSRRVHWIANSHSGAASYAAYVGKPVEDFHVVLNGVFSGHFRQNSEDARAQARRTLGMPRHAPIIAVINRLSEEKQPDLMLKVVTMVRSDIPDLRVLLAGAGPLEGEVRRIIRKRRLEGCVCLLGRVSDVDAVLSASDLLLLTSTLEGCPNVALEAQHLGIPVVATRGGGTIDAVVHGKTGFLCGVHDPVDLALAVRRLLSDHEMRDRFGRCGQAFVDECFSINRMIDLTISVYRLALAGNPEHTRIETPKHQFDGETTDENRLTNAMKNDREQTIELETRPIAAASLRPTVSASPKPA
jgi:glycosyltransferase involved in cell wall biosynthesis